MKKKFKLNEREQEQIDLLKKYYEIDDEKRIIKVILHYASIDETLLCDIESINHPQFDESLLGFSSGYNNSWNFDNRYN